MGYQLWWQASHDRHGTDGQAAASADCTSCTPPTIQFDASLLSRSAAAEALHPFDRPRPLLQNSGLSTSRRIVANSGVNRMEQPPVRTARCRACRCQYSAGCDYLRRRWIRSRALTILGAGHSVRHKRTVPSIDRTEAASKAATPCRAPETADLAAHACMSIFRQAGPWWHGQLCLACRLAACARPTSSNYCPTGRLQPAQGCSLHEYSVAVAQCGPVPLVQRLGVQATLGRCKAFGRLSHRRGADAEPTRVLLAVAGTGRGG